MKKLKKYSLIKRILFILMDKYEDLFDLSIMIMFNPHELMRTRGSLMEYRNHLYKNIYNLNKSPYFDVKDGKFYLNYKGRIEIIRQIIKDKRGIRLWDHKWRAIIFDVPEKNRHERNFLRKELKWMGFKELQHSVWITPYDIEKELLCLLKLWHKDFKGDIRFLKVEKIINDQDFRKTFSLQK